MGDVLRGRRRGGEDAGLLAWAIGIAAVGTLLIGILPYLATGLADGVTLAFGR